MQAITLQNNYHMLTYSNLILIPYFSMHHVWRVHSADVNEWQLVTLRGAALLTLTLQQDGQISQGHFVFNPAGK